MCQSHPTVHSVTKLLFCPQHIIAWLVHNLQEEREMQEELLKVLEDDPTGAWLLRRLDAEWVGHAAATAAAGRDAKGSRGGQGFHRAHDNALTMCLRHHIVHAHKKIQDLLTWRFQHCNTNNSHLFNGIQQGAI
jgi:hypothetical protein